MFFFGAPPWVVGFGPLTLRKVGYFFKPGANPKGFLIPTGKAVKTRRMSLSQALIGGKRG